MPASKATLSPNIGDVFQRDGREWVVIDGFWAGSGYFVQARRLDKLGLYDRAAPKKEFWTCEPKTDMALLEDDEVIDGELTIVRKLKPVTIFI